MTRLADITGLDWIGIPVFQSVRPLGRALSVHQGKGLTADAARIGALMEAVESHHAEGFNDEGITSSFADLAPAERCACISDFARNCAWRPAEDEPLRWVQARRFIDDQPLWVPFDVVSLDFTRQGDHRLGRGSDGLAAHFDLEAATSTAVLELIERDAFTVWSALSFVQRSLTRIEPDTIPFGWFSALRDRVGGGGVHIAVYALPGLIPAPALLCELIEPGQARPSARVYGSACHPDPETALLKAVLEAAQSRLTWISGARDDVLVFDHAESGGFGFGAPLPPGVPGIRWPELAAAKSELTGADSNRLAQALADSGFRQTAVVDLSPADSPVVVVKAVSPGLAAGERSRRVVAHTP